MPLEPISKQDATQFKGLATNADPRDIGVSASQEQTNLLCLVGGQLQCRGGNRPAVFANGQASVAGQVIGAFYFQTPSADWVVFQQADGTVRVGRGAS
jgi:hypothetical protein